MLIMLYDKTVDGVLCGIYLSRFSYRKIDSLEYRFGQTITTHWEGLQIFPE